MSIDTIYCEHDWALTSWWGRVKSKVGAMWRIYRSKAFILITHELATPTAERVDMFVMSDGFSDSGVIYTLQEIHDHMAATGSTLDAANTILNK